MATQRSLSLRCGFATFAAGILLICLRLGFSNSCFALGDSTPPVVTSTLDKSLSQPGTSAVPARESLRVAPSSDKDLKPPHPREKRGLKAKPPTALTPVEREQRRMEIRQRLSHRMEALRQKRKTGSLTPEEEKQLHRLEALSQGFQPPLKKETQDGTPQKKAEPGAPALHTTPASPQ